MRKPLVTLLFAGVLAAAGCSSSGTGSEVGPPAYTLARLKALLVTAPEAGLTGYHVGTPDGEQQSHTSSASRTYDKPDLAGLISVSLIASTNAENARAAVAVQARVTGSGLRSGGSHRSLPLGHNGVEYTGTATIEKSREIDILFAEGPVVVMVMALGTALSPTAVEAVAQAQDTKLRAG